MEQYYTNEELQIMYRDYTRDDIIRHINRLDNGESISVTIFGKPECMTMDFHRMNDGTIRVHAFPRILGSIGTVTLEFELTDIIVSNNDIFMRDETHLTRIRLNSQNIRLEWW